MRSGNVCDSVPSRDLNASSVVESGNKSFDTAYVSISMDEPNVGICEFCNNASTEVSCPLSMSCLLVSYSVMFLDISSLRAQ
jgi:hypothetical protein